MPAAEDELKARVVGLVVVVGGGGGVVVVAAAVAATATSVPVGASLEEIAAHTDSKPVAASSPWNIRSVYRSRTVTAQGA